MLQIFKNHAVTKATLLQVDIRQKELNFYTNIYWTWCSFATVTTGFVFDQLTNPVPEETPFWLESLYLFFTASCLGLNLNLITTTVLFSVWGPGMALRGPNGMQSSHRAINFLREEMDNNYLIFNGGVTCYFASTCTLIWIYPSRSEVNVACMVILTFFVILTIGTQCALTGRLKESYYKSGQDTDGHIVGFDLWDRVADLDSVATRVAGGMSRGGYAYMPIPGMEQD